MARFLFQGARLVLIATAIWGVAALDGRARTALADTTLSRTEVEPFAPVEVMPFAPPPALPNWRVSALDSVVERRFEGFVLPVTLRDSIVRLAHAQVGRRYRFGGTTPQGGFDCSGLVAYVLKRVNISLPRTAYLQARVGAPIEPGELQPGDIVSFGPDSVSHIGIFVGDGRFVHASSVAGRVVVSALHRKPSRLIKPLHGARRLLAVSEAPFNRALRQPASAAR